MAETFGEADVILRVRMDELQRQLDQSERLVEQSTERVAQSQARAAQEVQASSDGAANSLGDMAGSVADVGAKTFILIRIVRVLGAIKVAAGATVAALAAFASPLAIITGVALALEAVARVGRNLPEILERIRKTNLADAFAAMQRKSEAAFQSVGTGIGNAFNALAEFSAAVDVFIAGPLNQIGRAFGEGDLIGGLREATKQTRQFKDELKGAVTQAQLGEQAIAGMVRIREQSQRDLALARSKGPVEQARVSGEQDAQSIEDAARGRIQQLMRDANQEIAKAETEAQKQGILQVLRFQISAIEQNRDVAIKAAEEATARRMALAEREARNAEDAARTMQKARIEAAEARLADDPFEAARIEAEAQKRLELIQAEGNARRIGMIEQFYDRRQQIIEQREQEHLDRQREMAERVAAAQHMAMADAERRVNDTREDLQSDILQERLRQAGQEMEAQAEAIRQRFEGRIEELEEGGHGKVADMARKLRDMRIEGLESQRRGNMAIEVSRSRLTRGEGNTQREEKKVTLLAKIEENTRETEQGRVFR